MKFTPLTEEEMASNSKVLLQKGPGTFEVLTAVEKISKSGNNMVELKLKVWDVKGKEATLFDYLVSTAPWKIKHFFESVGRHEDYMSGEIVVDNLIGLCGTAKVDLTKDERYGEQNKIKDYIPVGVVEKSAEQKVLTDDIPF